MEDIEAEAAALSDLNGQEYDLDREIQQRARDADVELELAALKQQASAAE